MSFADCILGKAGRGLVRPTDAERAARRFDELAEEFGIGGRPSFPEAKMRLSHAGPMSTDGFLCAGVECSTWITQLRRWRC